MEKILCLYCLSLSFNVNLFTLVYFWWCCICLSFWWQRALQCWYCKECVSLVRRFNKGTLVCRVPWYILVCLAKYFDRYGDCFLVWSTIAMTFKTERALYLLCELCIVKVNFAEYILHFAHVVGNISWLHEASFSVMHFFHLFLFYINLLCALSWKNAWWIINWR